MTDDFDQDYWDQHWQQASHRERGATADVEPNPHLVREVAGLPPGTALDAGCGEGAEAIWLAARGWQVTAADLSTDALARAAERAAARAVEDEPPHEVQWVQADLTRWEPGTTFDLVTTHYAHPTMPQLAFYERLSGWVTPGGNLLVVGHLLASTHVHGHAPPARASVTLADVTGGLDPSRWDVVTAAEHVRTLTPSAGRAVPLHDLVVRAVRLH